MISSNSDSVTLMQRLDYNFGDHLSSDCSLQLANLVIIPTTNTTGEPSFSLPFIAIEPVTLDKYLEDGHACVLFVFFIFAERGEKDFVHFSLDSVGCFLRQLRDVSCGGRVFFWCLFGKD